VLIQEQCELGIETEFWAEKPVAPARPPVVDAIDVQPAEGAEYEFAELAFV
jgi:hypothetical protein